MLYILEVLIVKINNSYFLGISLFMGISQLVPQGFPVRPQIVLPAKDLQILAIRVESLGYPVDVIWFVWMLQSLGN